MKIKINEALAQESTSVRFTAAEAVRARKLAWDTKLAADKALAAYMPTIGFGRDALVDHIHMDANHGKQSDRAVVSRVVNVFFDDLGCIQLRIQLGATKGGLSGQYASIPAEKITALVDGGSYKSFQY